jgi:hypothetical protein
MTDVEHAALIALFDDLATRFGVLDLEDLQACYEFPCTLITPQAVTIVRDRTDFEGVFAPVAARLRADGFARSAFTRFAAHKLSDNIALASMHWTRLRHDGTEIERLGATYTVRRTAGHWRIVSLIAHAPETVVTFA